MDPKILENPEIMKLICQDEVFDPIKNYFKSAFDVVIDHEMGRKNPKTIEDAKKAEQDLSKMVEETLNPALAVYNLPKLSTDRECLHKSACDIVFYLFEHRAR